MSDNLPGILSAGILLLALATGLAPGTAARAADTAGTPGHPNILLILSDDLGYGDLGCYQSGSRIPTPRLDRLAAEGLRFTDAHSPSTVCTPTRYSLLTGRMAFRNGVRGVFAGAGGPCLIEPGRLTLPGLLRQQGYTTACFGKWHIGLTFSDHQGRPIHDSSLEAIDRIDFSRPIPDGPIHRGFDHFFGTACCPTTDWLYAWIDGDRVPRPPTGTLDRSTLPDHAFSFDNRPGRIAPDFDLEEVDLRFLEKSREFLQRHASEHPDKPFFLFHSMQAVHLPSFPADQFKGRSGSGPHGDFIVEMDHIVGELLDTLESLGLSENTLVIFTSDNGPEVGTTIHMREDYGHDPAHPWRGMKRDQWEGGHRVPLIARWPGRIAPGTTAGQTVCLTDLMATCAGLVGADLPADAAEDSFDLGPLLLAPDPEKVPPIRSHTLHQTISLALAIRKGDWKYLDHQGSGGNRYDRGELLDHALPDTAPDAPGQLYHLGSDPGETRNLYHEHPEVVRELKAQLEAFVASGRSAPLPPGARPEPPRPSPSPRQPASPRQ